MNVGDQIKVTFIDIDYEGRGVCKLDGNFPIFVGDAIKGETALIELTDIRKSYGYGKIIRMYEYSPFRVSPKCSHYEQCGGCNLMHLNYQSALDFKTSLVRDTLKRISNVNAHVYPCVPAANEFNYRNKLEFHFSFEGGKIRAGFYNEKSHKVVDLDKCLVEPEISIKIITFLKSIFKIYGVPIYKEKDNRGCIRHVIIRINRKQEIMVVFVTNTNYLKMQEQIISELTQKFPKIKSIALSFQPKNNNIHIGEKTTILWGDKYLKESILGLEFMISPESFFQVNLSQTERLYSKVLELANLTGNENVIDAYCGIGTISLFLAKKAKHVYGIEIVEEAIKNAKSNAKLNKITNTTFIAGPCEEEITNLVGQTNIDLLVMDPPRKGMERKFIDTVGEMKINRLIYVSCNIRTMARDLVYLKEYGYDVDAVYPFDMFPNTTHVECIAVLSRND